MLSAKRIFWPGVPIDDGGSAYYDSEAKKGSRVATAEKDGKKARKLKASGKII